MAEEKLLAEKKRLEEEYRLAEEKLLADKKKLEEEYQLAEEKRIDLENQTQNKKSIAIARVKELESNMDDSAPLLSIAEYLEVDNKSFSVSGIVLDDSKVFIEVNGSPIKINSDNTFNIQGYAPIGKNEIKVTAFDEWNNITRKVVIIERKLDTASTVNAFENLNPDKLYSKEDANRFALIIGIEEYENISDAKYAKRDAQYFIDYAQGAFGVPRNNIKFFFDKNAKEKSRFEIKKWLKQNINDDAEIFVYFSGHRVVSPGSFGFLTQTRDKQ